MRRSPPPAATSSGACGASAKRRGPTCIPRSSASWPRSSTPSTASSGPSASARWTGRSTPRSFAPTSSTPSSAGCDGRSDGSMTALGWLSRSAADVPPGEDWLGERERAVHAALAVAPRRESWRLGRWTAKCAVAAWLGAPPGRVEVVAAPDGAPEAWIAGELAPVALSISHRAGRGLAVVAAAGYAVGCDLEVVEPRSDAFIRDWLAAPEQAFVGGGDRAQRANLVWTAKEAAAKVRREGLRLDVRSMVARLGGGDEEWSPLEVAGLRGWWRAEPGWVMSVASEPAAAPPRRLQNSGWRWPSSSV